MKTKYAKDIKEGDTVYFKLFGGWNGSIVESTNETTVGFIQLKYKNETQTSCFDKEEQIVIEL